MCTNKIARRILNIDDNYSVDTRLYCQYCDETKQSIGVDSLTAWAETLAQRGYAAATVNRRIAAIRSRLRLLFSESGEESFNVLAKFSNEQELKRVKGMKINSKAVDPSKVLSTEDVSALIQSAPFRIGLIIEFLYVTGCRISEALGTRQSDVKRHRDNASVRIVGKGAKERIVRIPLKLFSRIKNEFRGRYFLFETETNRQYCRHFVEREVRKTGMSVLGRRVTPHYLRHSFATTTIERTGKIKGVSKYLGHASTTTTMDMYNQESLDFLEIPSLKE